MPARARNRANNRTAFFDRITVTRSEAMRHTSIGPKKIDQLIEEGVLESTLVGSRRYVFTDSIRRLLDAGKGKRLAEPVQLRETQS